MAVNPSGVALDSQGNPIDARQLAENYGFAWAFLKHHKDVWGVFQSAVKQGYSTEKFKAAIQNTTWWTTTQSSVRKYQLGVANDPKSWAATEAALRADIAQKANAMGAIVSSANMAKLTKQALMHGWGDSEVQGFLASYIHSTNGVYHGQAATNIGAIKELAWRNGLNVSSKSMQAWAQQLGKGTQTLDYYKQYVRNQAKALAPGFQRELDAGMDLYDIADPYIQAKAKLLQKDPASIDLFDSDIRAALSAKDSAGKPTSTSLWQFEQNMRAKPEYMKTDAARDQAYATAHQVLKDFGFMGN